MLAVRAEPIGALDEDRFELSRLGSMATLVVGAEGSEHLALSDGLHRIRLDIVEGTLRATGPVRLHFLLSGMSGIDARLLTIRRLAALWRKGAFVERLFPREKGSARRVEALRAADARAAGASYGDIAAALYGEEVAGWSGGSDYLVSRVRRRLAEAAEMQRGGWRNLLRMSAPVRS